jgi:hypothetical protein
MRQVDEHVAAALSTPATQQYRKALGVFMAFLAFYQVMPDEVHEWDDLLLEWKADINWVHSPQVAHMKYKPPSKDIFAHAIAAVEKAVPKFQGQLLEARAAARAWKICVRPHSTVPLPRQWAMLMACWMSSQNLPRLGATLLLQYLQCLRPSEALNLLSHSFATAAESLAAPGTGCLFLGQKTGTKSGRPQVSLVRDPLALKILDWFRCILQPGERLSPFRSLTAYNRWIKLAAAAFKQEHIGWTAHSPRAGKASDDTLANRPFQTIREEGRWTCDKSLRGYLDIMAVMGGELSVSLAQFAPLLRDVEVNFDRYFRWQ